MAELEARKTELEARKTELEFLLADANEEPVLLHPNLSQLYRSRSRDWSRL